MRGSIRTPGYWNTLQSTFRNHPIQLPLILLCIGILSLIAQRLLGYYFFYATPLAVLMVVLGAILLPIGIVVAIRRHRNVVALRCPRCGMTSGQETSPFRVEYPPHVDYAHVTCSNCQADFTADRFATLT